MHQINQSKANIQPIFALRKLEWEPRTSKTSKLKNRRITKVVVSNYYMVVATNACSIIRFKINDMNKDPEEIEISAKPEDVIDNVFLDYGGFHLLVCLKNGDNYYLSNMKSSKVRKLSKLTGNIECAAFDRSTSNEVSGKPFLLGTSLGMIYEMSIDASGKERTCQVVYQLSEQLAISSIYFDYSNSYDLDNQSRSSAENSFLAMFSTSSPTRLYHFLGGPTFQQLFSDSAVTTFTELPGEVHRAELHCFSPIGGTRAQKFALMTGAGIYNGSLEESNRLTLQLNEAHILPYIENVSNEILSDNTKSQVLAIGVTEFHFLVLKSDKFQAVSALNGELVQEDVFRNSDGAPVSIARDSIRNSNFIYTNSCLFQVVAHDEDRQVWSTYLAKALVTGEDKLFESALAHSKSKEQKQRVMKSRAEFCVSESNWEKAALCFSYCGLSVDEVILKLLNIESLINGEKDKYPKIISSEFIWSMTLENLNAIKIYLLELLKVVPSSAKSQRTMICTWLCEIYLHQFSVCASSSIEEDIKLFMRSNRNFLDLNTILSLLLSRNDRSLLLFFSKITGDYHGVVSLLITEQRYVDALDVIKTAPYEKIGNFVFNILPVLIEHVPLQLIQVLLSKPQFTVSSLIPTILRYTTIMDRCITNSYDENFAIHYFEELFAKVGINMKDHEFQPVWKCPVIDATEWATWVEPIAINTMIWLLAKYDNDETKLVSFVRVFCCLRSNGVSLSAFQVDGEFILRQCRLFNRRKGAVYALLLVNNPVQSIREALAIDLDLAKTVATQCRCGDEKNLWLEIAKFIVSHFVDTKRVIALIGESAGVLKIEDLLPILSDFTDIDCLKDDICKSLAACTSSIDTIKSDMAQLSESVDNTLKELDEMKNRALSTASSEQRCGVCFGYLFDKQFYLFPCSHGFHGCCLLAESRKFLSSSQLSLVKDLEAKIKMLFVKGKDLDSRVKAQLEALQLELDGFIAADCLLCGSATIDSLNRSLIGDFDNEAANNWNV